MKKIILLALAFASFAFGAEGDATATIQAFSVLAAGVGLELPLLVVLLVWVIQQQLLS